MGAAGSDVAIETADVALMQDDISKLPYLFSLSRKTMGIIKQNITLAITVKLLCVNFCNFRYYHFNDVCWFWRFGIDIFCYPKLI